MRVFQLSKTSIFISSLIQYNYQLASSKDPFAEFLMFQSKILNSNGVHRLSCEAEIVISGGLSIPKILTTLDAHSIRASGVGNVMIPPV